MNLRKYTKWDEQTEESKFLFKLLMAAIIAFFIGTMYCAIRLAMIIR
jgi:hypothetical protein